MKFQLRDSGLYCYSSEEWQRVGGWIEVIARTRLVDKRRGHGALLQWKNMDGVMLQEVVYARILNGENSRQVRELLVDTGYPLEPTNTSWSSSLSVFPLHREILTTVIAELRRSP